MRTRALSWNLTASLAIATLLDFLFERLLGRLFLSHASCDDGIVPCLVGRSGPFFNHLAGILALVVLVAGMVGLLARGELVPRGARITTGAITLVFVTLAAWALGAGHLPERYHFHLFTSFGFVALLLTLSFAGAPRVPARTRVSFALFSIPALLHALAAVFGARTDWHVTEVLTPERLEAAAEIALLSAAATAPLGLLPRPVPRARLVGALGVGIALAVLFYVALVARYDLVQAIALYGLRLEVPRPTSPAVLAYAAALVGLAVAVVCLIGAGGSQRLAGYGVAMVALVGFEPASPVELAVVLAGLFALAAGARRTAFAAALSAADPAAAIGARDGNGGAGAGAGADAARWRGYVGMLAAAVADPPAAGRTPVLVEITADGDAEVSTVGGVRRGHPISLRLRREGGSVRSLAVTVGARADRAPDATIEPHELWLERPPAERLPLPRHRSGDTEFDRKLIVHGDVALDDPELRRRLLGLADAPGTVTVWRGETARFEASWPEAEPHGGAPLVPRHLGSAATRPMAALVDALVDLVARDAATPAPPPPPPTTTTPPPASSSPPPPPATAT